MQQISRLHCFTTSCDAEPSFYNRYGLISRRYDQLSNCHINLRNQTGSERKIPERNFTDSVNKNLFYLNVCDYQARSEQSHLPPLVSTSNKSLFPLLRGLTLFTLLILISSVITSLTPHKLMRGFPTCARPHC